MPGLSPTPKTEATTSSRYALTAPPPNPPTTPKQNRIAHTTASSPLVSPNLQVSGAQAVRAVHPTYLRTPTSRQPLTTHTFSLSCSPTLPTPASFPSATRQLVPGPNHLFSVIGLYFYPLELVIPLPHEMSPMSDDAWQIGASRAPRVASTTMKSRYYLAVASGAPGSYGTWREFQPQTEPWRGLTGLHRSYGVAVSGTRQDAIAKWAKCPAGLEDPMSCVDWKRTHVLPPPPRRAYGSYTSAGSPAFITLRRCCLTYLYYVSSC